MDAIRVFRRAVARGPDRTFAFDRATAISYAEADRRSDAIAADLQDRGLAPGQPLGLSSADSVVLLLAILGAWKAGLLPAMIDARTGLSDLPYFVGDIGAPLIAATPDLHDRLRAAGATTVVEIGALGTGQAAKPDRHGPESPLYLSYTSGTTGAPKGAVLDSGPVALGTACIADRLELQSRDVLLATTPTSSSFQLVAVILPALHAGATIGLVAGAPVDEIWQVARDRRATVLVAYPLTLSDVVNAPDAERGSAPFRMAVSGGSPLAPRVKRDYRDRLGIALLESYGQSELGGFMALGRVSDGQERMLAGYVGRPLPDRLAYVAGPDGSERAPGQVGEVVVAGGYFSGYWRKPEATEKTLAGGVLHTGDLGVSDPDGYLKVLGRTNEGPRAERRGGFLRELEDAFYEHPAIQHAAIVESSDGGIASFVELRVGQSTEAEVLTKFASERVNSSLRPQQTTILQKMPRSFSGKADRRLLAERS